MKDFRLDSVDWYAADKDLLMCLYCGKYLQTVNGNHLKCHKMTTIEYKKNYNILMKTPLKNKRLLQVYVTLMNRLRKEKRVKLYKKGETSIPLEYQKASTKGYSPQNLEYRKLLSVSQKGVPKTEKYKQAMSDRMKGTQPKSLLPYMFKKGMTPHNKIGGLCTVKDCDGLFLAKGYCSKHYQQAKKLSTFGK